MREQALTLEAEAGRHPDWASELLLDAATAWRRAGEQERAIGVLREPAAAGGEEGQFAQVLLAEVCLDLGRDDAARAELAALKAARRARPVRVGGRRAVRTARRSCPAGEWYDAAAAVLTDDELAALGGEFGWPLTQLARRHLVTDHSGSTPHPPSGPASTTSRHIPPLALQQADRLDSTTKNELRESLSLLVRK